MIKPRETERPALRAPITPYCLLNIVVVLSLGIVKNVCSARGQSVMTHFKRLRLGWRCSRFSRVRSSLLCRNFIDIRPDVYPSQACMSLAVMKASMICPEHGAGSLSRTYPVQPLPSPRVRESLSTVRVLTSSLFRDYFITLCFVVVRCAR